MIGIMLLEVLLVPFFPRCVPSTLKRLLIEITIIFLSTTVKAGLKIAITNQEVCLKQNVSDGLDQFLPPYQVILVPYILAGIGILFVYVTSLEFILAQAPYRMQGLLIGFWFLQFPSINLQEALGILIFTANIIQFGTDQLQGASSVKLASFAQWYIIIYFTPITYFTQQSNKLLYCFAG